jgi:hypothetical protein
MDLNNEVNRERLIQNTITNPKSRGGLLPSHGGERCRGVGEGGEAVGGDSDSGSPCNLPTTVSLFSIFASIRRENEYLKVYRRF